MIRSALLLLALASCARDRDPWAKQLSLHEREAWGRLCGEAVGDDRPRSYEWVRRGQRDLGARCLLIYDRRDRLDTIEMALFSGRTPTLDETAPYIAAVEPLLGDTERQLLRQVAREPRRVVETAQFRLLAGYDQYGWSLSLHAR